MALVRSMAKIRSAAVSCRTEVCYLSVEGGSHSETSRVHHAARRRGGEVAARGACAGGANAAHRPLTGAPKAIRKYKPRTVAFRQALERKVTNFACAARCLAPAPSLGVLGVYTGRILKGR